MQSTGGGLAQTVRKCLHFIERGYRGRWVLLVVLALVVAGFEAGSALLVYALLELITAPAPHLGAGVLMTFRDTALPDWPERAFLMLTVGVMAVFFVMRAAVALGHVYLEERISHNTGARLSVRLLGGYLRMPYEFHLRRNSAELIRNAYQASHVIVGEVFVPVARLMSEVLVVLAIVGVLLFKAPVATGLAFLVLGPPVLIVLLFVHPWLKRLGSTYQLMSTQSFQSMQQGLHGARDITLLGREEFFLRLFARQRARLANSQYLRSTARTIPRSVLETAVFLFILSFLGFTLLADESPLEALAILGLFAYAALRIMPSLNKILVGVTALKFSAPAIEQLYDDLVLIESSAARRPPGPVEPLPFTRTLALHRVSFRYGGSESDVIHDVSLSIARGEFIGIVGPTGSGKSTLVDLLLGLLQPSTGSIQVDGLDLRGRTAAWQQNLGVVSQSLFLIDDTLRRNIAFGIPDTAIDEQRLAAAVRLARLDTFVASLPDGLDNVVGERGVRLSGGQRQRVAIARALYRRPAVLVLDEGTSALDSRTEAEVMSAVRDLPGTQTVIAIAHRLSTVRACDRIVLIEGGHIVDVGTYEELDARNTAFRDLARAVTTTSPVPEY
jgi:ATP-binding cassette, subfamily B, bacterial PglK